MTERITRGINHFGFLNQTLRNLKGYNTLINELAQNADDAPNTKTMTFNITQDYLIVENDGVFSDCGDAGNNSNICNYEKNDYGPKKCDFHRFRSVASGDKREQENSTGAFGIGFNSVYQITDHPQIISAGRHWIINDDRMNEDRIDICEGCRFCKGDNVPNTRFVFPWAKDSNSIIRKKLDLNSITNDEIEKFKTTLLDHIPNVLIFLNNIVSIIIKNEGIVIEEFNKDFQKEKIIIFNKDNTKKSIFKIYQDNFRENESKLRQDFGELIDKKKKNIVQVAFPLNVNDKIEGLLYSTLPTEVMSGFIYHINADFYPKSDRKGIILDDDYQSKWNRAIFDKVSDILIKNLEQIAKDIGHIYFWKMIDMMIKISKLETKDKWDTIKKNISKKVIESLDSKNVIFTTKEEWKDNLSCKIFKKNDEYILSDFITSHGIDLPHEDIRKYHNHLREYVKIKEFTIDDFVRIMENIGLTKIVDLKNVKEFSENEELIELLWQELIYLNFPMDKDAPIRRISLAPDQKNVLYPFNSIYYAEGDLKRLSIELFNDIHFANFDSKYDQLYDLCNRMKPNIFIEKLKKLDNNNDDNKLQENEILLELYKILKNNSVDRDSIRELNIFKASGSLFKIEDVYLPNNFDDTLKILKIIETNIFEEYI
nr:hypothetical protein [Candidatus Cloacimonadota bacterium]